jgi:6-phosphogluconolactonase (cycloisomerase 2 family)
MAYSAAVGEEKLYRFSRGSDGILKPLPSLPVKGAGRVIAFFGPARNALYVCYALKKDYEQLKDNADFDETKIPVHYDVYHTQGTALPKRVASLVVPGGNLIFEPQGRFAYVSRRDVIGCYRVQNDGSLKLTADVKVPTGKRTVGVTFDPKGRYAYVNHVENGRSVLSQFRLDGKRRAGAPLAADCAS